MTKLHSAGVVVGRFQVAALHEGHRFLLDMVSDRHQQVVVILGSTSSYPTARNPLSFEMRSAMVRKYYPDAMVLELKDHPSDAEWSNNLDALVDTVVHDREVVLYGSRDSFLRVYTGRFERFFVPSPIKASGKKERERIARRAGATKAFRAGVIYSAARKPPQAYQAVDAAVLNGARSEVLLAAKTTDGGKRRFIGGFVDPTDPSLEAAAKREVIEETSHIETDDYVYLGSRKVDDWRYRGTQDGIMTALFRATYIFGAPRPADDIVLLEWVPLAQLPDVLVDTHKPLGALLLASLERATQADEHTAAA